jgi:arsenate reductase (glutaredoxin)
VTAPVHEQRSACHVFLNWQVQHAIRCVCMIVRADSIKNGADEMSGEVVVWHNPGCGSSKNAVEYLSAKGIEPQVYLYLKAKPGKKDIEGVLKKLGMKASGLLRPGEKIGEELGLYAAGVSESAILDAMAQHAKLIQRPVVMTSKGAVIARPKTKIDDIL